MLRVCVQGNVLFVAGDATVTISHRYTPKEQLRQHTKIADIIVAAAGLCNTSLVITKMLEDLMRIVSETELKDSWRFCFVFFPLNLIELFCVDFRDSKPHYC